MPLYDVKCDAGCGYFEVFVLLADFDRMACPECTGAVTRRLGGVQVVGPRESKPLVVNQVGRTFTSPSEYKAYLDNNPGSEVLSADSAAWKSHVDRARNKAEATARKLGYRDLAQSREKRAVDRAKQRGQVDTVKYF